MGPDSTRAEDADGDEIVRAGEERLRRSRELLVRIDESLARGAAILARREGGEITATDDVPAAVNRADVPADIIGDGGRLGT